MKVLKKSAVFLGLTLVMGAFTACENSQPATEETDTETETREESNMEDADNAEMTETDTLKMEPDTANMDGEEEGKSEHPSSEHPN